MIILRQKIYSLLFRRKSTPEKSAPILNNELPEDYYKLFEIYSKKLHGHTFFNTEEYAHDIWSIPYPQLTVLPEDNINKSGDTTGTMPVVYLNNSDMVGLGYDFKNKRWYEIGKHYKTKDIPNLKNYITSYVKKTTDRLKTIKIPVYDDGPSEHVLFRKSIVDLIGKKDYNLMIKYCNDLYNFLCKDL